VAQARDVYRIEGLTKVYGERLVLDIPFLRIPDGALVAITGENGAGKSTLLRMLAFVEEPTTGRIFFRGANGSGCLKEAGRDRRCGVTLVEQHPYLFQSSVYENLVFGLKVRGVPKALWPSRLEPYVELLDLGDLLSRRASAVSAGEAQRVALARALAVQPGVLLLDEIAANLDAGRLPAIEKILTEVRARGTSILFSTHDLGQARRLADRVLRLSEGRLLGGNGSGEA